MTKQMLKVPQWSAIVEIGFPKTCLELAQCTFTEDRLNRVIKPLRFAGQMYPERGSDCYLDYGWILRMGISSSVKFLYKCAVRLLKERHLVEKCSSPTSLLCNSSARSSHTQLSFLSASILLNQIQMKTVFHNIYLQANILIYLKTYRALVVY